MGDTFPYVNIPPEYTSQIGKPDPGTRVYRKSGSMEELGDWFRLLSRLVGPTVSPGGVCMFCPVSRAAVHKRTKEGRLSIFLYHVSRKKTGFFGKQRVVREQPYAYIPISEAEAWRKELEERAIRREEITAEEIQGGKADESAEFMEWPNKKERPGLLEALSQAGITPKEAFKALFPMVMGTEDTGTKNVKGRKKK